MLIKTCNAQTPTTIMANCAIRSKSAAVPALSADKSVVLPSIVAMTASQGHCEPGTKNAKAEEQVIVK